MLFSLWIKTFLSCLYHIKLLYWFIATITKRQPISASVNRKHARQTPHLSSLHTLKHNADSG